MTSKHELKKPDFALLRSNGLNLKAIAEQLEISPRTAERWNKDPLILQEIKNIKNNLLDELQKTCRLTQEERINKLEITLAQINEALTLKNLKQLPAQDLLILQLRYLKALRDEECFF